MRTFYLLLALALLPVWMVAQSTPTTEISPEKPGTYDGRTFRPSVRPPGEVVEPIRPGPLHIDSIAIVRLSTGTQIGNPEDMVIVVYGEGFWETEYAPRLHLGSSIVLEEAMVGKNGKMMYVTLPASKISQVKALNLREIQVQNPGGLELDPKRWTKLVLPNGVFNAKLATAKNGAFQIEGYFPVLTW